MRRGNPDHHKSTLRSSVTGDGVRACKAERLDDSRTRFTYHKACSRRKPCWCGMRREHSDFSRSTCTHWHHRCIIRTHHSCAPPATSYHTQYAPEPDQPFQFLANLGLQPSSVVTLVLSPTYYALYGTSFFPTPTRVSSVRGTRLAPVSSASGIHVAGPSPGHTSRKPRHVPIPPLIPREHSLTPGTIPN